MISLLRSFALLCLCAFIIASCTHQGSPTDSATTEPPPSFSASYLSTSDVLLVSACYYPWYSRTSHWGGSSGGNLRDSLQPSQPPQLGHYDCNDQSVISQHVAWSKQAGIDFWISSWWGQGSSTDDVILKQQLTNESFRTSMGYCLLYEPTSGTPITVNDSYIGKFLSDLRYLDTTHFKNSNYVKIDGKPVLYIYLSRTMTGTVQKLFQQADSLMIQLGYKGLYVVGDEVYWNLSPTNRVDWMDAVTAYNPHTSQPWVSVASDFINRTRDELYDPWMTQMNARQKPFWVDVIPGFNDLGVRYSANHPVIPRGNRSETWSGMLQAAKTVLKKQAVPLKVLVVTSWNEWHEDTQIEPTVAKDSLTQKPVRLTNGFWYYGYGTQLLDTLKTFRQRF